MQSGVELELIERLKKKQVEQQQALQELQDAMALTTRSGPLTLTPHNPKPHSPHASSHCPPTCPSSLYTVVPHILRLHAFGVVSLMQYNAYIALPVALQSRGMTENLPQGSEAGWEAGGGGVRSQQRASVWNTLDNCFLLIGFTTCMAQHNNILMAVAMLLRCQKITREAHTQQITH